MIVAYNIYYVIRKQSVEPGSIDYIEFDWIGMIEFEGFRKTPYNRYD